MDEPRPPNPYRVPITALAPVRPMTHRSDPDGDLPPATATAYVAQMPRVRPNPNTIEGMLAGIGEFSAATVSHEPGTRRRARLVWWLGFGLPTLLVPLAIWISHLVG